MDFGSARFSLENHQYGFQGSFPSSSSSANPIWDSQSMQYQQPTTEEQMESSPTDEDSKRGDYGGGHGNGGLFVEKEHMFDKVVTPSDVGKLNRLVIPKQHAEKYFPLDSSSNDKGLLLNFEDRSGKSWRFRYSYWTSSQSYVMTKGWSRFVKEKRLDAGDIVSFQREVGKDRFFIDWRRRPHTTEAINFHHGQIPHHFQLHQWSSTPPPPLMRPVGVATPLSLHRDHVLHLPQNNNNVTLLHNNNNNLYRNSYHPIISGGGSYGGSSVFYHLRSAAVGGGAGPAPPQEGVFESVPVGGHGKAAAAKTTLRLFGVNMECAVSESSSDECDITNSSTTATTMPSEFQLYNGRRPIPNMNILPTDFLEKGNSSMSSLDFGT